MERSRYPQRKGLQTAEQETLRMRHLLDDLLDLSRGDSGRLSVSQQPVALRPLLEQVQELAAVALRNLSVSADAEVKVVQEGGIPRLIEMLHTNDEAAKEQALLALRNFSTSPDNAAKVVRERGLAPLVACLAADESLMRRPQTPRLPETTRDYPRSPEVARVCRHSPLNSTRERVGPFSFLGFFRRSSARRPVRLPHAAALRSVLRA